MTLKSISLEFWLLFCLDFMELLCRDFDGVDENA